MVTFCFVVMFSGTSPIAACYRNHGRRAGPGRELLLRVDAARADLGGRGRGGVRVRSGLGLLGAGRGRRGWGLGGLHLAAVAERVVDEVAGDTDDHDAGGDQRPLLWTHISQWELRRFARLTAER